MKLNISGKIIFIAVAGVVASSLIILCLATILMSRLLDYSLKKEMTAVQSMITRMQQQDRARLLQVNQLLTSMPDLVEAVHTADVDSIMETAQMSWLQQEIDSITFTNSRGITIFRTHSDLTGDDISSRAVMQEALNGNIVSGVFFDETALVPYTIRCYAPVFRNGVLVGSVSLGTNICTDEYVDYLFKLTGIHFSVYEDDVILVTSLNDKDGKRSNGYRLKDAAITGAVLGDGASVIIRNEMAGDQYLSMYWPIESYNDEIIGMWSISMPMNHHISETNRVLYVIFLCSLGIMSIFILAAGILGNKISLPIRKITEFTVNVAKGNLDDQLTVESTDELGQLAGSLRIMVTALKEHISEAVMANKAKSSFLSTMSHEIRTPMNAIIGITEIQLRNEDLAPDIMEAFERIYASGDVLMSIINDILDLSKIESGKLELFEKNYEFASMISDTAHLNMMRIGSKQISFELNVDDNIPATLWGDELRVKQILNNVLSNAFKYTESGKVTMSIKLADQTVDTKVMLVIAVSDTGQGMSRDQVDRIFDDYARFNNEANRKTEGTGLGMSIARNLIIMMNGTIQVESEVGKGSTFTIQLLQGKAGSAVIGREVSENLRRFRLRNRSYLKNRQISIEPMPYGSILIVDDVDSNIYVAKGLMLPYGLQKIDSANSGQDAINKIKDGNVYDIVFMDHMMPGMDGIEAVKHLREDGYNAPIVALSANAIEGQAEIFMQNGFDGFISKPIDMRQLNVILNTYIRDRKPQDVIEEARRQAHRQNTEKPVSEDAQESLLSGVEIPGLDIAKVIKRFGGNEKVCLDVLRSYAASVNSILNDIGTVSADSLADYTIQVHGIKGTSFGIFAEQVAKEAQELEEAGRSGDLEFIKANHPVFAENARNLVSAIEHVLSGMDLESQKPFRDKPDITMLLQLKEACTGFDMDGADEAMDELEKYQYEADNDLIDWLRSSLERMQFEQIVEKLSEL